MAKKKEIETEMLTMEDYLLSQLDTPLYVRNKTTGEFEPVKKDDGSPMTKKEAIATNLLNMAIKGDVRAAQYIQSIQVRAQLSKK